MHLNVDGTPYYLAARGAWVQAIEVTVRALGVRVEMLRSQGKLTEATLQDYYGEKRFEQIAESNALEGSTLTVGETELAVMKGITITGHDPGFSRDAQALARAVDELVKMARDSTPTDIEQVKHIHELILGDRAYAGDFRRDPVIIRGSQHKPPQTWDDVMKQMEHWEEWSQHNPGAPVLLRASVLHAWLAHIHPFRDGNGRTARAITNLELVRAGYPPIIIRRKDRDRYLDALGRADEGDLGAFIDLIAGRMEDSLRDLERAAQRRQGYDVLKQKARIAQNNRLALWNAGVHLLFESIKSRLVENLYDAEISMREYDELVIDDFIELCEGHTVSRSWAFAIRCRLPGMPDVEFLAWAGVMAHPLQAKLAQEPGRPALLWSIPNPDKFPPWMPASSASPGGQQMTIFKDRWLVARDGQILDLAPGELAVLIVDDILARTIPDGKL